jgi:hypothetical protein
MGEKKPTDAQARWCSSKQSGQVLRLRVIDTCQYGPILVEDFRNAQILLGASNSERTSLILNIGSEFF